MSPKETHILLAKWANEVATLADTLGITFPASVASQIKDSKKAGDAWFDPITIRMTFRLVLIHKCFGFVFGYISENELNDYTDWFITFSHKFWCGKEYEPHPTDSKWTHISLRPSRLLPR